METEQRREPRSRAATGYAATEKPLFIPLKREFFEAFERGEKTEEYRPMGPRWNHETCRHGREVVLSLGYGKGRRLRGKIVAFTVHHRAFELPGWVECYGDRKGEAAVIGVKLHNS
jgi:hypothetical protein